MLAVGLLGPVTTWRDDTEVGPRGTRQRALLAALALEPGHVVPSDVLVERVWGDDLPARPDNALQQQVLKLRRLLGEDAVVFDSPGYRLAVDPGAVDAERFERLVERARSALERAPDDACTLIDDALALWRGPALAEVLYEDWAAGAAARLEELRLQCEELRADAILRCGRHAEVIGELERLVWAEPLREKLRALLMLALYRDGRQAAALTAYSDARSRLVDDLGVEPGAELRALHERILQQDPALAGDGGPDGGGPAPATADVVLPAALARLGSAGMFVGRDSELALLADGWQEAVAGQLAAAFIAGDPGVGKTRLVAELARAVAGGGGRVVYARADPEAVAPYGFFVGALRELVESAPSELLRAHVETHGGELVRLAPGLAIRVPRLPSPRAADPDTERMRLQDAALGLLRAAATRAPTLLVLDDIHWADRASLALLLQLLRGPDAPLLAVATYRATGIDQRPALRALLPDLLREPETRRLELSGLSEHDVGALLEAALGRPLEGPETALGRAVHRETEGNALFATEVLRHLEQSGRLSRLPDDDPAADLGVPPTLRELVVQRLEQIGGPAATYLPAATVIGTSFDVDTLARLTSAPEGQLLDLLDRACDSALVVEARDSAGRFHFSHAVIRAALSQTLGAARRRQLHRRLAEEIDASAPHDAASLAELARHWIEAGAGARASDAAARAGDAALALLAPHDAMRWYQQALELHDALPQGDEAGRGDLLVRLGEAERRAGSDAFRSHLLDAGRLAHRLGDADLLARAALANNRGMHSRTGFLDKERIELLEAALALRGTRDDGRRALLLATASSELWSGDHDRRRALSDEALAVARRVGDKRVLAEVIYRRAFAIAEPATLAERLALTRELVELSDALGDPLLRLLASVERSRAAIEICDLAEALDHAERQGRLSAECGDAYGRHGAGWAQGWPPALAGRYEDAERAAERALAESLESDQPDALAFYGAQIAAIRWDQGRLGELADGIVMHAQSPDGVPAHHALAALALAEGGRFDEANRLIDQAFSEAFALPVDTIWLTGTTLWGEGCIACERADCAELLLERLLPWCEQVAFTGLAVHGAVARVAAELAALLDRDDAGELFALAEVMHERLEAPAFLARTRVGWARWLARRGQAARAADLTDRAREPAVACGCPHLLAREPTAA